MPHATREDVFAYVSLCLLPARPSGYDDAFRFTSASKPWPMCVCVFCVMYTCVYLFIFIFLQLPSIAIYVQIDWFGDFCFCFLILHYHTIRGTWFAIFRSGPDRSASYKTEHRMAAAATAAATVRIHAFTSQNCVYFIYVRWKFTQSVSF